MENKGLGIVELGVLGIIALAIYQKIFAPPIENLKLELISVYNSLPLLFVQWKFWLTIFIILLPFIIYLNYKLNLYFINWKEKRKLKKKILKEKIDSQRNERINLKVLILTPIDNLNAQDIKELKDKLEYYQEEYSDLDKDISDKIREINFELPILRKKERINQLNHEEDVKEKRILEMEELIRKKELQAREFEETSLNKLNAGDTKVFLEEDLTQKEKALLLKNGYKRAYEFCVFEQDYVRVLVKPTMKHSVTHTFLVWSAVKMISKLNGTSNVFDWDTRESDITFKYHNKNFAVEIETGTLLSKKVQLRAKIDYLNSRYKNRWMIVVSKKSLLSKYRKFGLVSSRSEFQKKLKNLLKSA
ncbi:MAG: hypothetical protein AABX11_03445 [Nanoarchaeota archaeon]